jgi:hypothetical protein
MSGKTAECSTAVVLEFLLHGSFQYRFLRQCRLSDWSWCGNLVQSSIQLHDELRRGMPAEMPAMHICEDKPGVTRQHPLTMPRNRIKSR